jgi:REP element-mobilizing transposase RayT
LAIVVVGYVVMPEHVHLLISEPEDGNHSIVVQVIKQRFAHELLGQLRQATGLPEGSIWKTVLGEGHVWQKTQYGED